MPIRFSTEAANADHIRMDVEPGKAAGMSDTVGADGTPRDRADRSSKRSAQPEPKGAARKEQGKGEAAKPGKDINAAGFIKDKDAGKP